MMTLNDKIFNATKVLAKEELEKIYQNVDIDVTMFDLDRIDSFGTVANSFYMKFTMESALNVTINSSYMNDDDFTISLYVTNENENKTFMFEMFSSTYIEECYNECDGVLDLDPDLSVSSIGDDRDKIWTITKNDFDDIKPIIIPLLDFKFIRDRFYIDKLAEFTGIELDEHGYR
jgi:hypothetical protein